MNIPEESNKFIDLVANSQFTPAVDQTEKMFEFVTTQSQVPFVVVDKKFDAERAKQEIQQVESRNLFVRYFSKFTNVETEKWYATALFGQSATNPWNAQTTLDQSSIRHAQNVWSESAECMPYLMSVIDDAVGIHNVNRCVCFKLDPGGYVSVHRDEPADHAYSLKQVNFHIQWPEDCVWYMEGVPSGIHSTSEGSITMHSSVHAHTIVNRSNTARYFVWLFANFDSKFKKIAVDGYVNQYLKSHAHSIR
jgi:hypothetical protein